MVSAADETAVTESDAPERALRTLLYAAIITPILLMTEGSRTVVSPAATAGGIALGAAAGTATGLLTGRLDADRLSTAVRTSLALGGVVAAGAVVWVVVPYEHVPTFAQFAVAFVWATAIAACLRHVVWPRVTTDDDR